MIPGPIGFRRPNRSSQYLGIEPSNTRCSGPGSARRKRRAKKQLDFTICFPYPAGPARPLSSICQAAVRII